MVQIENIHQKVLDENVKAHDYHAKMHDRNVPYIHRLHTRVYYWKLLSDTIASLGKQFGKAYVLELGCGTGTFTDMVLKAGAKRFSGIDVSPKMIEQARLKIDDRRASYEISSLESYTQSCVQKFDIIFSFSFLHHLYDVNESLLLIKSMLKPGGIYVGLHEPIMKNQRTIIERIDHDLQCLFGYSGYVYQSFPRRVKTLLSGLLRSIWLRLKRHNNTRQQTQNVQSHTKYVDYQLTANFSLSGSIDCAIHKCKVVPYSFLAFPELLIISKPLNYEMVILRNLLPET